MNPTTWTQKENKGESKSPRERVKPRRDPETITVRTRIPEGDRGHITLGGPDSYLKGFSTLMVVISMLCKSGDVLG